jgi:hypothetical protein
MKTQLSDAARSAALGCPNGHDAFARHGVRQHAGERRACHEDRPSDLEMRP